jgi:hypothetical protein
VSSVAARVTSRASLRRRLSPAPIGTAPLLPRMSARARLADRPGTWCLVIVVAGTLARLGQVAHSVLGDHAFRQAQTAFTVREYAAHGVDLLSSPVPVFGAHSNVLMEFPLFQALASLLVPWGLADSTATRLTGLLSFQAAGILWYLLLRRWHGPQLALLTLVMYEVTPFGLHWGASALIDFFSVMLGFAMVLALDHWFTERSVWGLAAGVLAAWALFLVKVTTVPTMGMLLLLSAALFVQRVGWRGAWRRVLSGLLLAPGTALVPLLAWTSYADSVKERSVFTEFLTSRALFTWNFGTVAERLDGPSLLTVGHRIGQEITGLGMLTTLGVVLVTGWLGDRVVRTLIAGLLLAALAGPAVFFHLYVMHSYYLIALYPVLVTIAPLAMVTVGKALLATSWLRRTSQALVCVLLLAVMAFSSRGSGDVADLLFDLPPDPLAVALGSETPAGARIVMVGCDWNPQVLYAARRTGLMLRDQPSVAMWTGERIGRYAYLARCSPEVDPVPYLPAGYTVVTTRHPDVFAIRRTS